LDNALRLETNNRSVESATWRFEFDNDVFFHEIRLGHNIPRGFVYVPDPIGLSMRYKAALKPVNPPINEGRACVQRMLPALEQLAAS